MTADFKNIPSKYYPALTWVWNTKVTKEGIKRRIDEFYNNGTKAMYLYALPPEFRPYTIRTHFSPKYLSDEYFELLRYTYDYAYEKGMYIWLYNEAGWPSGNANGFVVKANPDLYVKEIGRAELSLNNGEKYKARERAIAAFCNGKRVRDGFVAEEKTAVTEYFEDAQEGIHSDVGDERTLPLFIDITYEKMKKGLPDYFGKTMTLMFDDEAMMHSWTRDLDKKFFDRYGYEIADYMPVISGDREPVTHEEHTALADYYILCGEIYRKNYLIPNKKWLNENNMLLTGHLNYDNDARGGMMSYCGNFLETLRVFDVPGVDEIWGQIAYPKNGKCCFEGSEFYPRLGSSAARQNGGNIAMSESFAVTGAQLMYNEMRYIINYQAVMGINLFNCLYSFYDEETPMSLQFRPNLSVIHPAMDFQTNLNDYIGRLSYIMQNSNAEIDTALYYPARSIAAKEKGVWEEYDKIGKSLEEQGVSFDIIDEKYVQEAVLTDNGLCGKNVSYKYVIVPNTSFELPEVIEKLTAVPHELVPCIERSSKFLKTRKQLTDNGCIYLIVNCDGKTVTESVKINETAKAYEIDLYTGDIYEAEASLKDGKTNIEISLVAGEGKVILFTNDNINTKDKEKYEFAGNITDFSSFANRRFVIDETPHNEYYENGEIKRGLYVWDKKFSGEVTYTCYMPNNLERGDYILDLGEVRYCARVFLNGKKQGEAIFAPFRVKLTDACGGDKIEIVVANTIANECAGNPYFDKHDIGDVGPYNEDMQVREKKVPGGGLIGDVKLYKILK